MPLPPIQSASPLTSANYFSNERMQFHQALDQWLRHHPSFSAQTLVAQLKHTYDQNNEGLYLVQEIATLPPEIWQLPQLTDLHIGCRPLENLPAGIEQLQQLKSCSIESTGIRTLPDAICELEDLSILNVRSNSLITLPNNIGNLKNLSELYLSHNNINELPESIDKLVELVSLDLSHNQLRTVPNTIDHLQRLASLVLSNNQLTTIPTALLQLPSHCHIYLEGNPLSNAILTQLYQTINTEDYDGPSIHFSMMNTNESIVSRSLSFEIFAWYEPNTPYLQTILNVWRQIENEPSAADFAVFLHRLHNTVNSTHPEFKNNITAWLNRLSTDKELREQIFLEAKEGLGSCEDRLSLTLNTMKQRELKLNIQRGQYDQNLEKIIAIARQQFRFDELGKIAYQKVQTLRFVDEIEVYLAYQVKLRKVLHLAIDTSEMRFFHVSYVTQDDLNRAATQVKTAENQNFLSYLSQWEPWKTVLERLAPSEYKKLQSNLYKIKEQQFKTMQDTLLIENNLEDNDVHRMQTSAEVIQRLEAEPYQTFTQNFLRQQETKGHGKLSQLLNPVWKLE